MKNFMFVVSTILLLVPLSVAAQSSVAAQAPPPDWPPYIHSRILAGHEEWLECQGDDQCTQRGTLVCGVLFAVNKDYSDQAYKVALERAAKAGCDGPVIYPPNITAKCINNECVLAIPQQQK